MEISSFLPHIASCADDICLLRGCYGDSVTHPESVYLMNTGSVLQGRPSLGSWVAYGLGTENHNMPAFVVMPDPHGWVKGGAPAWGNGYLPALYQGTEFSSVGTPVLNLRPARPVSEGVRRDSLDFLAGLNREHRRQYPRVRTTLVLFTAMSGMAFGSWFAGRIYDHFGFYAPAFGSGVLFNLLNLALIGPFDEAEKFEALLV